ncbi:MAG: hypothetical protein WCT04_13370 [Planctomycetota bacterium]
MTSSTWIRSVVVLLALGACAVRAADRAVADSLAVAGASMAAKGNMGQAKEMFYKALANDENCPDAIFELAKIFEKEGSNVAAGDFYQRSMILMAEENKPASALKRTEAEKRMKALNPFAARLGALFEDYSSDLDKLVKKVPDTLTKDAAFARVNELKVPSIVTSDKLPKFYASARAEEKAAAEKAAAEAKKPRSSFGNSGFSSPPPTKVADSVPPEVERELKTAGWTKITGTWVKKGPNTYEVTNGKLEAQKTNGAVDVIVYKIASSTATVRAAVRNGFGGSSSSDMESSSSGSSGSSSFYSSYHDYDGYGLVARSKEFRLYGPSSLTGFTSSRAMEPSHIRNETYNEAMPKNRLMVSIMDGVLELSINEKKSLRYNQKGMPTEGPFVIEVHGTAIIENPRCAGQ